VHLLAIGAHAADMEFTVGGIIAQHTAKGHTATLLHLTPGEKGHRTLPPEAYAQQKIAEAEAAAARLGATARFLPYRDGELPVDEAVKWAVADVIREERPDVVITHWHGSIHRDHTATHHIVQDALFYAGLPAFVRPQAAHAVRRLYYAENWEDPVGFEPDVYVDITDVYERWLHACEAYALFRGEVSSFRYRDYYRALATCRGCLGGFTYAQALMRPAGARRLRVTSLGD
jgi:LmbE family N-acetylglucosaminyl deacetylase